MCVVFLARSAHPDFEMILALNRDEFFDRPTQAAGFWLDRPEILAGRDLRSRGTWAGVTRGGRWAVITNFRDPKAHRAEARSRGELVPSFLRGDRSPEEFLLQLKSELKEYNPFNLCVGERGDAWILSSPTGWIGALPTGVTGVSNGDPRETWPKMEKGSRLLEGLLRTKFTDEDLLELLRDREQALDDRLPKTGVTLDWERALSPIFISAPALGNYGTRSSTLIFIDRSGTHRFVEITYDSNGGTRRFSWP